MKRRVTLKDVAKAAGVHVSTASRALDPNNRHLITSEAAERILAISREIGYRHNAAAASLRTARTRTAGVVVPDITNPIFSPIVRGVEDVLLPRGLVAIVGNTDGDARREEMLIAMLQERGVDGFILACVELQDPAVERLAAEGRAVVTLNRQVGDDAVSSVEHDEDEGIRRVLTHLVSLGHEHIASIGAPQHLASGVARYLAFERHRDAMPLAADNDLVVFANQDNEVEGERCVEELLARGQRFTAIVCASDRLAIGAIGALTRRGIACPDDISVTGYNDLPMTDLLNPPLTTVRVSQYQMGCEAAEILAGMIETGVSAPSHVVLPVDLVIRGSTRAVAKVGVDA